jgi:hypothetical protein
MEVAWEKERKEQKRLLNEAHALAMDLQVIIVHKKPIGTSSTIIYYNLSVD